MTLSGLVPGSLFARDFRIVRRLGEGGMGRVYVVEQISTGAQRALKLMHPVLVRDDRFVRRFEQEAKIGSRIDSDHIVHVVAAGVDEDSRTPWLAMELLEGERLSELLDQRHTLSVIETQDVMSQLLHGLAAAHAIGVVHRDLKPENIFLARARREGIPFTVKLLDFGIAKIIAEEVGTSHDEALGSVLWMAPEQTIPGSDVTAAADVWSLGLLAFRMLAGVPFWRAASVEPTSSAMVLREVVLDPIVPASFRAAELGAYDHLPEGFDAWFSQCVCRDARKRFADAAAAKTALMHVLYVAGGASPEPDPTLASRASLVDPPIPQTTPVFSPRSSTLGAEVVTDSSSPTPPSHDHPAKAVHVPPTARLGRTTGSAVFPTPTAHVSERRHASRWILRGAAIVTLGLLATLFGSQWFRQRRFASACEAQDPDACQKLCTLVAFGSSKHCVRAGDLHQRRSASADTVPSSRWTARLRALGSYLQACDRGELSGCARAAILRQQGIYQDRNSLRDEPVAASLLRRACKSGKGDPAGCLHYGIALRMGYGTGRNSDTEDSYTREAADYFKLNCDPARGGKGCFWLGYLYQYGGGGIGKNEAEAESHYRLGCSGGQGDAEACNQLAEYHEHGVFTPRFEPSDEHERVFPHDPAEAMDRYDQARKLWDEECRDGDAQSCLREAILLWNGKGENPAPERASELMQMACDMGYAPACQRLHAQCLTVYLHPRPGVTSRQSACDSISLLTRACDGLWAQGCLELGAVYTNPQDKERAFRSAEALWLAACDGGNGESCLRLAQVYTEGKPGVPRNAGRAITYYDRACDREDPEGCKKLADVLRTGLGIAEPRPDSALVHYDKACELMSGVACYNAALMIRTGQGARVDKPRAATLFQQSCDLQTAAGCHELGRMYEQGDGVSQDAALARKYYARACNGCTGETQSEACTALGALLTREMPAEERAQSHALLVDACDSARISAACHQAARDWADGIGTQRDIARASDYRRKACQLGFTLSCEPSR